MAAFVLVPCLLALDSWRERELWAYPMNRLGAKTTCWPRVAAKKQIPRRSIRWKYSLSSSLRAETPLEKVRTFAAICDQFLTKVIGLSSTCELSPGSIEKSPGHRTRFTPEYSEKAAAGTVGLRNRVFGTAGRPGSSSRAATVMSPAPSPVSNRRARRSSEPRKKSPANSTID